MYVCAKPRAQTYTECELRFPLITTLLQIGLLLNPIEYRYLLRVLYPVRRPVTIMDCVLLKDNRAFVARLGSEISSRDCLCVLQGPRHITKCWLSNQG
jgi:hypothetical protein